mmetsp:Transcript_1224/g.2471  ORF Transcript_1224/g.2471 Transcript_1224/m.2471 type:complete len:93 (-) Transcript_1224:64-342(-)
MQAHVDRFNGKDSSGRPNLKTLELWDTDVRLSKGTETKSSPNWQFPGGIKLFCGGPTTSEFVSSDDTAEVVENEAEISLFFFLTKCDLHTAF